MRRQMRELHRTGVGIVRYCDVKEVPHIVSTACLRGACVKDAVDRCERSLPRPGERCEADLVDASQDSRGF